MSHETDRYRLFIEKLPDAFAYHQVIRDSAGRPVDSIFLEINKAFEIMTGLTRDEIIGKKGTELLTNGQFFDFDWIGSFARLADTVESIRFEHYMEPLKRCYNVTTYSDKPFFYATVFHDITSTKLPKVRLCESEARLQSIFRVAPVGIGLVSSPGRVLLHVNQKICDMTGYCFDELIGQNALILYPTEENYEIVGRMKYTQIVEHGTGSIETRWKQKDGGIIHVLLSSTPIDPGNLGLGITFTVLDITERKQVEEALQYQFEFEKMVGDISSTIVNTPHERLDEAINHALKLSGAFFNADRSYIECYSEDGYFKSNTHEWCADGIASVMKRNQNYPVDELPWWTEQLKNFEHVYIPDVELLPPEAAAEKEDFKIEEIQSLLTVPMVNNGQVIGFLGFDSVRQKKLWTEEQISLLKVLAAIISGAIVKRRTEETLLAERSQLISIFDSISESIYVADPETYEILYVNEYMNRLFSKDVIGGICYRGLQGLEEPCEFCTNKIIMKDKGKTYKWEYHNRVLNKDFLIMNKIIRWPDGHDVRFEMAVDITERKQVETILEQSREWYRTIAEDIPAFVVRISLQDCITYANDAYCRFFGAEQDQIVGKCVREFIPPENYLFVKNSFAALTLENPIDTHEHTNISEDGSHRWIRWTNRAIFDLQGCLKEYLCIGEDITERRTAENTLRENEMRSRALVNAIPDMLFRYSKEGLFLDAKVKQLHHLSKKGQILYSENRLIGQTISEILPADIASLILAAIRNAVITGELQVVEYRYPVGEEEYYFEARLVPTGTDEVVSIVRNITERKRYEAQLQYLSLHEPLTGLYNRAYYENELQRLENGREYPVAIISADLDCLKMINDIMGHKEGDRILKVCAQVLKGSLRKSDRLARIGGDEFVLIMPRTDNSAGEEVMARIRREVQEYNRNNSNLPISISLGMAVSKSAAQSLEETFKTADSLMYRDKLYRSENACNQIIKALFTSFSKRKHMEEGHAERLQELCWKLGKLSGLNMHQQTDLSLLTLVYDIGMVGISDRIQLKDEEWNEQERDIMLLHPEKGFRIANSSPDLAHVADLILRHHECWDGSGYPMGLEGENIPIECRILSIVVAYETMINPRPNRYSMSKKEAFAELERYAGTRFDPQMVKWFIQLVGSKTE